MFKYIDFNYLLDQFVYNEFDPLIFSTTLFLFLFFGLLILYRLVQHKKNLRVILLLLFSFYFYYKATGLFFFVVFITSIVNYFLAIFISDSKSTNLKRLFFYAGIIINLGLLGYFKYTNFFIEILNDLKFGQIDPLDILLPIGISFYTFKAISYLVEIYWETLKPERNFLDFTLYIAFFANILAGPIDRANEFLPQIKSRVFISREDMGTAVFLIISGLIKKAVIADYISLNFVDRVFDSPLTYTGMENLLAVYGYTLQIYCDFSGYTDMALGISLLLGFRLMENFNQPYKATSVADFWRRWHISLSTWLLDYLFRPLQMKFRDLRNYGNAIALLITFILCGLWHGADWTFVFWGTLHGFFMAFAIILKKPKEIFWEKLKLKNSFARKLISGFITFHLIAFSWVFFRAYTFQDGINVFSQIFTFLQPEVLPQFIVGYSTVVILIFIGYFLHFLPLKLQSKSELFLAKMPVFIQAIILAIVIYIVSQFKSADLQPFIYFQF